MLCTDNISTKLRLLSGRKNTQWTQGNETAVRKPIEDKEIISLDFYEYGENGNGNPKPVSGSKLIVTSSFMECKCC